MRKDKNPSPEDLLNNEIEELLEDSTLEDEEEEWDLEAEEESMAEGDYPARCIGFEQTESSTGNKQFKLTYKLHGSGQKQWQWLSLTPQARWRLVAVMKAFGCAVVEGRLNVKKAEIVGKDVVISIKNRTWQGNTRPSVEDVRAMTPEEARDYADQPL